MKYIWLLLVASTLTGCSQNQDKKSLAKMLEENPEIIFNVIEKHPEAFMKTVQMASKKMKPSRPEVSLDEEFKNPKKPEVVSELIVGDASAPILIVEYTDFECPFCARGNQTVAEIKKLYGSQVKFIKKHLPLPMHNNAKPAALYYEAIVAEYGVLKAHDWSDKVFANQSSFRSGNVSAFFDAMAKSIKLDPKKINKALNTPQLNQKFNERVQKDLSEAQKFGFFGTPGFLINGVSLKGAYPVPMFKQVIDRHLSK